ncbi:MAG TPA: 4-hydroxy-tetrahydrodipicolinate reductase [Clostridia bacterium]|nr:4-hydroxy-tetrahydrodipicolinate reductase [Clostridia bacterium]
MTRVVVTGAAGRMGREAVRAILKADDMQLVGAVDVAHVGEDVGELAGLDELGVSVQDSLPDVIRESRPEVMVDLTNVEAVLNNIKVALRNKVRTVVGATGLSPDEIEDIDKYCHKNKIGCIIAPNFAVGALLMIKFAESAAKFFPNVEIIELHHDKKIDAPSGTALKTAEIIADKSKGSEPKTTMEYVKLAGARGGEFEGGIHIHSVRLPGLVAHQEVIFGGVGQTLTIRHDSISRESFMPGLLIAVRNVTGLEKMIYGLENIIFND